MGRRPRRSKSGIDLYLPLGGAFRRAYALRGGFLPRLGGREIYFLRPRAHGRGICALAAAFSFGRPRARREGDGVQRRMLCLRPTASLFRRRGDARRKDDCGNVRFRLRKRFRPPSGRSPIQLPARVSRGLRSPSSREGDASRLFRRGADPAGRERRQGGLCRVGVPLSRRNEFRRV